ncbi:hypothetical protein TNIN_132001 [Trichonephila inaurata madagascariensis]|uniref:Uncharacterized protein n=1 Tax=Trichonephila inaurata madagascariensis TaxID=2747483 RepID=A0A8X6YG59_9ARAC|nr:hypothetical protein TNIN_132001 [Trichonephila inaurata madagascariensis]
MDMSVSPCVDARRNAPGASKITLFQNFSFLNFVQKMHSFYARLCPLHRLDMDWRQAAFVLAVFRWVLELILKENGLEIVWHRL